MCDKCVAKVEAAKEAFRKKYQSAIEASFKKSGIELTFELQKAIHKVVEDIFIPEVTLATNTGYTLALEDVMMKAMEDALGMDAKGYTPGVSLPGDFGEAPPNVN